MFSRMRIFPTNTILINSNPLKTNPSSSQAAPQDRSGLVNLTPRKMEKQNPPPAFVFVSVKSVCSFSKKTNDLNQYVEMRSYKFIYPQSQLFLISSRPTGSMRASCCRLLAVGTRNAGANGSRGAPGAPHCTALHCSALQCTALHCTAVHHEI